MIRTVIYDLDDTLYDFHRVDRMAFDAMCRACDERFGGGAERYAEAFAPSYHAINAYLPEDIKALMPEGISSATCHSRTLRIAHMLEQLGLPLFPHVIELYDIYWNTILDNMKPEPYIDEVMAALKARGLRIGIGSNMTSRIQYRKLQRLGLGPYLDFVTVSEETFFDKPDPRFFDRVLLKAGCLPEECLFIGDNFELDYLGAMKVGMQALWYVGKEKPWNHVDPQERASARKLADHREVLTFLEERNFGS